MRDEIRLGDLVEYCGRRYRVSIVAETVMMLEDGPVGVLLRGSKLEQVKLLRHAAPVAVTPQRHFATGRVTGWVVTTAAGRRLTQPTQQLAMSTAAYLASVEQQERLQRVRGILALGGRGV